MNFLKKTNRLNLFKQICKFASVGIISTIVDVGILRFLLSISMGEYIAIALSYFLGVIVNYMLHGLYTFNYSLSKKSAYKYCAVILLNYLITNLIIYIFQKYSFNIIYSKMCSIPFIAINGFILSKYWIYKK